MGERKEKKDRVHGTFARGCFRVIRWLVWLFYPKLTLEGTEHLPEGGCILVGNHAQMNGPIAAELYVPGARTTWCAGQMMELKEVPAYAFADFWSSKPGYIRWFFKLLSYVIAPISVCVFNNAFTIPVYHDTRILTTFRQSFAALGEGKRVVIFPECPTPNNNIVYAFQEKFVDTAKMYYKRSGEAVCFVPMYVTPKLKKLCFGPPTRFDPEAPIEEERRRICDYLSRQITDMARALPRHTVVPYLNLPKKLYPINLDHEEANDHEKAGR